MSKEKKTQKGQKWEISRREFLYLAGVYGITTAVDGIIPFQLTKMQSQTIKSGRGEKLEFRPPNLIISCLRPDDLLSLDFECINLTIKPGLTPKLVRGNTSSPAYLVVHFPPQHIIEEAFFESTPDFKSPEKDSSETPRTPPVHSKISGETRLAFLIPDSITEIPLTLESLLSWELYEPSLVAVALPPEIPSFDAKGIHPTKVPSFDTKSIHSSETPSLYEISGQKLFEISKISPMLNLALLKIVPPSAHQTAIELPYRLILSPNAMNVWRHCVQAVTRNGRTELWHTRLAVRNPDGTVSEMNNPYLAVRAVWSPDCNVDKPLHGPGHNNKPFRMSLDSQDRHEIVHLTSNFSLKRGSKAWEPKPVDVNRLMLSPLGGWLDSSGEWIPTPLSVEEWRHKATMGRDHYVKVVYKGFLFPFGHPTSLIKITERKFRKGDRGQQIAYLFQRMYIVVRAPEKIFPAPFQLFDGREIPFRNVRLTTLITPPLEDPKKSQMVSGALQSAFWPRVAGKDFQFHCIATDWAGNEVEFDMPMPFVDAIYAFEPKKIQSVISSYNQDKELLRRQPSLNGQKVAFASSEKKGDTELEVEKITFAAKSPASNIKIDDLKDADQPFFPVMEESSVSIPALKSMVKFGGTQINYPKTYINYGFISQNKGEVFAAIASSPTLSFASNQAGGVATPSFSIVGLSRALGPVGGQAPDASAPGDALSKIENSLSDIIGGRFDPTKFFNDQAKLLGGLLLKDIIQTVKDFMSDLDSALTIKNEVVKDTNKIPTEVHTYMKWKPKLQDFTIFVASRKGNNASLTIDAKSITYLNGSSPYYEFKGELKDFTLDMIKPITTFIRISFKKFTFTAKTGQKTDFDPNIDKIEFAGPLNFIKELLDKINLLGSDDSGGGGGFGTPIVQVDSSEARLGYKFNIPTVAFGVFTLQNIRFMGEVTLPFSGDPLNLRFAFSERHSPFLLTVSLFGGGGFFAMVLNPNGIQLIEGSLEFGGSFCLSLGVASGGVTVMAGIYFKYESDNITISGYVRCCGCVDVLGIISISVEFYLSLTYEEASNRVWGQASLTVKVKVLFFSASVTLTVERSFGHSPAPLFADTMDEGHWLSYCEAFA